LTIKEITAPQGQFKWLDITAPTIEDLMSVSAQYNLNNHNLRDCLEPDHLPKFEEGDDYHFIILRKVLEEGELGTTIHALTTKIAVFYNNEVIVTIHRLPQDELLDACIHAIQQGRIIHVNQMLLRITAKVQQSFNSFAGRLNAQIEEFETGLFIRKTAMASIESLYMLKRQSGLCRRLLLLTGEVVNALQHRMKKSNELQDIRDSQAKMQLFYEQLSEDAINLVSTYMSYSAQKTNDVMKVLTIFSAYFLPLTFIVGVYGMNFEWMPEIRWKYGYPAIILLMLVVFILIYLWFRRRKWL
jgi:magnesium transporter